MLEYLRPALVVDVPLHVRVVDDLVQLGRHVRHGVVGLVQVLLLQLSVNSLVTYQSYLTSKTLLREDFKEEKNTKKINRLFTPPVAKK